MPKVGGDTFRRRTVVLIAGLALAAAAACEKPASPDITIVNVNTNTINVGQSGTNSAEPTVKGNVKADTATVTVNGMAQGEACPDGIKPANVNKQVRLGCSLAVTVNPRRADGTVIQDDHAPPVDFFVLAEGSDFVDFRQDSGNSYNGLVKTKAAGKFGFLASVVGVATKDIQEFEVVK